MARLTLGDTATEPPAKPKLKRLYELDCRKKPTGDMVLASWGRIIRKASDAAAVFSAFTEGKDRESFMAAYLDSRHRPIAFAEIARGAINVVGVSPRDLFQPALATSAAAVIVAHNHPSGDPSPSDDDERLTNRIRAAGELIGVPMLDHLVVSSDGYYSFADSRLTLTPHPSAPVMDGGSGGALGALAGAAVALVGVISLVAVARRSARA